MRAFLGLTLCVLAISGCATSVVECHGQNWYRLGLEDGMADAPTEVERYAASCGADFGRAQYERGFVDGLARRKKPG